jgi:hypothetical protein
VGVLLDPVAAGEVRATPVSVINDGAATATMTLRCSDLSAAALGRIPATAVTIEPHRLEVPPGGAAAVVLTINVPGGTRPGLYTGFLQEVGNPLAYTTVGVEVH